MYRIGLVGAQSFHAQEFSKLINQLGVIDAAVTHIWGEPGQEECTAQLSSEYKIQTVCYNYTDMLGNIDAAMLLTRNGADHFKQAKPFMDARIPIWIDKPVALHSSDVATLCDYAQSHHVPLMGGSTLKHSSKIRDLKQLLTSFEKIDYFSFSYCSSIDAPTGGASFYGIHLAEIIYHLFGDEINSIVANRYGKTITVLLNYKNGMVANLIMTDGGYKNTYSVIGGGSYAAAHIDCHDCYEQELQYLYDVLSGRTAPLSPSQFTVPVKIMEAVEQAMVCESQQLPYLP